MRCLLVEWRVPFSTCFHFFVLVSYFGQMKRVVHPVIGDDIEGEGIDGDLYVRVDWWCCIVRISIYESWGAEFY